MNDDGRPCCCGHYGWQHLYSDDACRLCGPACLRFHRVGEGHGHAFEWFLVFTVVLVLLGAWGYWRVRQHAAPPPKTFQGGPIPAWTSQNKATKEIRCSDQKCVKP